MRRVLGGVAAAILALAAVPALADDAGVLTACEGVPTADRLTVAGLESTVETPLLPLDVTQRTVVLDLAGQKAGTTASVEALVAWTVPANDYDIETTGGGSSAAFNATETAPSERASGAGIGHCESFTVSVTNFAAPVVVDTLDATFSVTLEEFVEPVEF